VLGSNPSTGPSSQRRAQQAVPQRTPLTRLRADEQYLERRKLNVSNYGASWIKPPGVAKSLHQIREERRELEEHQEALRREQLALELAEAEAAGDMLQGEGPDAELDEEHDLDDDIPDAAAVDNSGLDADGFGISDEEDNGMASDDDPGPVPLVPGDAYREAVARGVHGHLRHAGALLSDDEAAGDAGQMLQEEELVHDGDALDMDADLDGDVPEADAAYEHTATEDELSSSDQDSLA
jgi:hypothetical protein